MRTVQSLLLEEKVARKASRMRCAGSSALIKRLMRKRTAVTPHQSPSVTASPQGEAFVASFYGKLQQKNAATCGTTAGRSLRAILSPYLHKENRHAGGMAVYVYFLGKSPERKAMVFSTENRASWVRGLPAFSWSKLRQKAVVLSFRYLSSFRHSSSRS